MSEEIKFEPVFGDQSLFDGCDENAIVVVDDMTGVRKSSKIEFFSDDALNFETVDIDSRRFKLAMRRIIKTPVWTVADQKAGRLPEVGSKLFYTETGDAFEFVGVIAGSMRWACKGFQDGFLYFFNQSEMSPIKPPEEKAARLREEWCRKCTSQFYPRGSNGFPEMIYDALLSGELPMPKKISS